MKKEKSGGVYQPMVAAAIVTAIIATVMCDGGWTLWIGVLPALIVVAKIKDVLD